MASVPSTPARYSVFPTKSRSAAPVTPTRHSTANHRHQRSLFVTPSAHSPFTSLSFSTDVSLDTPESSHGNYTGVYADLASNWRSKLSQVGSPGGYQNYENQFMDMEGEQNPYISRDSAATLATPFHAGHRGRTRAQSLSLSELSPDVSSVASRTFNGFPNHPLMSSPLSNRILPTTPARKQPNIPVSPLVNRRTLAPLNTPPPNRILAQQHKIKGSFTDPVRQRKRPSVAQAQPPQDLFNIDENEFLSNDSYDPEDSIYGDIDNSLEQCFHLGGPTDTTFSDPPAPIQYHPPLPPHHHHHHPQRHHYQQSLPIFPQPYYGVMMNPPPYNMYGGVENDVNIQEKFISTPVPTPTPVTPPTTPTSCSVCGRRGKGDGMLAVLHPCTHPLCSTCLTAALNIVGEKDMECAVCKRPVVDFKLVGLDKKGDTAKPDQQARAQTIYDPLFSSPGSSDESSNPVTSIEEETDFPDFSDEAIRTSTPKFGDSANVNGDGRRAVVLRIDNVPWDITPPTIVDWLRQPIDRVHVLLDRKGKTMSHAFVEVKNEAVARAILRGETSNGKTRSSVLGKGKRARGVTVTRSGQEELMAAIFPSWKGTFVGAKPSLAGVDSYNIASSLEGGLLTENDVNSLAKLIQSPDSHFLKVPVLPFHSLISLLVKFPGDLDSRIFWPAALRDKLNNVTNIAVNVLLSRIEALKDEAVAEEHLLLVTALLKAAMTCQAFTDQQVQAFANTLEKDVQKRFSPLNTSNDETVVNSEPSTPPHPSATDDSDSLQLRNALSASSSFDNLAKEFGVTVDVVEALAQRLATSTKV